LQNRPDEQTPPADLARIEEITGGDKSFTRDLYSTFLQDSTEKCPQLEKALKPFQGERIYSLAHSFVGIATCLAADSLHQAAMQLEAAAKSGRIEETERAFAGFREELVRTEEFFRQQLELMGKP
jgi:HPt (histidine-containing phosphotransfer) domain-containing protein